MTVTKDSIRLWEDEIVRLDAEISLRVERIDYLRRMIAKANRLFQIIADPTSVVGDPAHPERPWTATGVIRAHIRSVLRKEFPAFVAKPALVRSLIHAGLLPPSPAQKDAAKVFNALKFMLNRDEIERASYPLRYRLRMLPPAGAS